jgi:hypothetical protein
MRPSQTEAIGENRAVAGRLAADAGERMILMSE